MPGNSASKSRIAPGGIEWVTQVDLSKSVGISVPTLAKYRKSYDDFPKPHHVTHRWNLQEMLEWIDQHPDIGSQNGSKTPRKREDLLCEQLAKRNALLDQQIAAGEGKYVDTTRLLAAFSTERAVLVAAFQKRILSEVPPEAEGKPAKEIAKLLQDTFDHFLKDVQNSIPSILKAAAKPDLV